MDSLENAPVGDVRRRLDSSGGEYGIRALFRTGRGGWMGRAQLVFSNSDILRIRVVAPERTIAEQVWERFPVLGEGLLWQNDCILDLC